MTRSSPSAGDARRRRGGPCQIGRLRDPRQPRAARASRVALDLHAVSCPRRSRPLRRRRTCVSTTMPWGLPSSRDDFPVLRATPGRRTSSGSVRGTSPSKSSISIRIVPRSDSASGGRTRSRRCRAQAPPAAPRRCPRAVVLLEQPSPSRGSLQSSSARRASRRSAARAGSGTSSAISASAYSSARRSMIGRVGRIAAGQAASALP